MRRFHILLLLVAVVLHVAVQVLSKRNIREATIVSMVAWSLFALAFFKWMWLGARWKWVEELGAIVLLALTAGVVLFAFYVRAGTLVAGVHPDAAYSYVGLTWFTELHSPITFVAKNPSYIQLPLMVFQHLPALAIGFDRLGAFSCLLGTILQVAILIAVMTRLFASQSSFAAQAATAALAAGVFSNRMLVPSYNNFGYTMPAICLGLLFAVTVDDDAFPDPVRIVGGLLVFALLQHYSGLSHVLPAVLAWLLLRRTGLRRLRAFLARNSVVIAALAILAITLVWQPDVFFQRIRHVTLGLNTVNPHPVHRLATKMLANWKTLVSTFPRKTYRELFVENAGSWTYLDIPPLGGLVAPLVAGAWILAAWSLRGRRLRYLVHFVGFVAVLAGLTALQHVLTDFGEWRDLTPLYALLVAGLLFVFRIPRLPPAMRRVLACYAVLVAAFNYVDLGNLHGRTYGSDEYARVPQQTMDRLIRFLNGQRPAETGFARIHVVLPTTFPLERLYMKSLARYGVPVYVVDAKGFCADRKATIANVSSMRCDGFLLVTHADDCPRHGHPDRKRSTVTAYLARSMCDDPRGAQDRPMDTIDLTGGAVEHAPDRRPA